MSDPDVAVVGGGIVGLATARALALAGRRVVVLEREGALGAHQTSHNSGVIHAGIYYAPGSLKARLCVRGRRRGSTPTATSAGSRRSAAASSSSRCGAPSCERLDELERRARVNGVPGLARLGADEIAAVEPAATGLAALHSPEHGDGRLRARRRRLRRRRRARTAARSAPASRCARSHEAPSGVEVLTDDRSGSRRARRRLRGRLVGPAGRSRRARGPTCASSRSAAPTCAWPEAGRGSSAARSTRCPTRRCRSSACTCRARSPARC